MLYKDVFNGRKIVWKSTVTQNDYTCSCGKCLKIVDDFRSDIAIDERFNALICPQCKKPVALIFE